MAKDLHIGAILTDILNMHETIDNQYNSRINMLVTLSTLVISVILGGFFAMFDKLHLFAKIGFVIIIISALACIILTLVIITPSQRKVSNMNIIYYKHFVNKISRDEYTKKLSSLLGDNKKIIDAYGKEIYELGEVLYIKFKRTRLASKILLWGISIGIILVTASFFLPF